MSLPPDVSEILSDVLDDIGVNERIREKRKRHGLLKEEIGIVCPEMLTVDKMLDVRLFGSQTEGSTTTGLNSDTDTLIPSHTFHVIQSMTEWKHSGDADLMMIQNEKISPGYCHLQYIKPAQALDSSTSGINSKKYFVGDEEKLFLQNTYKTILIVPYTTINGPAFSNPEKPGCNAEDYVVCLICKSSPLQASSWLKKQTEFTWPPEDVKESCRNAGCFIVPVGSKMSTSPELEWRVSTCLQERHLMFNLNITHLRCYVLMKMVLKTYIKPHIEDVLTSFMCKNVLFFCIAKSSYEWNRTNLLSSLRRCIQMLKECVKQRNCPHFMIPGNNLLAGKMTDADRGQLLDRLTKLMKNDETLLFGIQIDDLGRRLRIKLNRISHCPNIDSAADISIDISSDILCSAAQRLTHNLNIVLYEINHGSLEMAHQYLSHKLSFLNEYHMALVSSTLGSVMAALYIEAYTAISEEAFTYLEAGLNSDALSGRLKLASVLYCTGDFEKTDKILKTFQESINLLAIHSGCACYNKELWNHVEFMKASDNHNVEEGIKFLVAFCTRFLQCEIYCVPHELKYEIWRSYSEGHRKRASFEDCDKWMDLIVLDSVPYHYFLQYKVNGQLERRREQQEALNNLALSIDQIENLCHKETAFNLLGQCLEQENRQSEAFACYIWSLKHRPRNNAASLLMCLQLFKLWKKYNVL